MTRKNRGALHSLEKAYEIFSEQKDLYGFLMDFLEIFGSEMPLGKNYEKYKYL